MLRYTAHIAPLTDRNDLTMDLLLMVLGADDVQNTERNYAFDINSYDEWNGHLKRYGFVVIKSVASTSDVQTARSLFWDHFEISNKAIGLSRNDTNTWNDWHTGDT